MDSSRIEQLLESFATSALGVDLRARIVDAHRLPTSHQRILTDAKGLSGWCAWHTGSGPLTLSCRYDDAQSARVWAHVVLLEWRIGADVHHEGWWYCYPKFPRDWIKGHGR